MKLSFNDHMNHVVTSSLKVLGFLIRNTKSFTDPKALMSLFYSLVRSKLEYASIIWSPFYNYQSLNLESVQQRFLEYLYFRTHAVYPPNGYSQQLLLLGISYWVPSLQT